MQKPKSQSHKGAAPLGTTAKFQAALCHKAFQPSDPEIIDTETGEIQKAKDPASFRIERYILQSKARQILPNSRTAKCLRYTQKNRTSVDVFRSTAYKRAHYGGLQTCASVWCCPVCSAKISERRRAELKALIDCHTAAGGVVVLVTRTVPHARTDDLVTLLASISKAEASYKAHRDYKRVAASAGVVGTVRAVEVTHGYANGWHPHVHELLFLSGAVSIPALEESLSCIWKAAALRAGLNEPSRAHGLTVQDGSKAANYAAKWGLESELTQWHKKRGKVESRTPFDLLRQACASVHDPAALDSAYAAKLFRDYAEAFHGRHQLQFSRGLKKRYQIEEVSDDELVQKQDSDAVLLGSISLDDWRLVLKNDFRGPLLEIAANRGWEGVLLALQYVRRDLSGEWLFPESPPPGHQLNRSIENG